MDAEDKRKEEEVDEKLTKEEREELEEFADDNIKPVPNSMWGQSGTWWILGIAGILIIFLVIWVCFFYGPN